MWLKANLGTELIHTVDHLHVSLRLISKVCKNLMVYNEYDPKINMHQVAFVPTVQVTQQFYVC